jgi:hypothetical protein
LPQNHVSTQKQSFGTLIKILNNQNYSYWKEDLRGCLAFDLLNNKDNNEDSFLKQMFFKMFDYV